MPLRVLVISDIHATSDGAANVGWIHGGTPRNNREHPVMALRAEFERLKPDLILVCGDISDKADELAFQLAWSDIADHASATGARLIGTVGNHDLDSRHNHGIDARGFLYDIDPPFPSPGTRDVYWARNYAIISGANQEEYRWRVVTLNTSAFHGYVAEDRQELEFGRVSDRTISRMREELAEDQDADLTILLMHHHPLQLPIVDREEQSKLVNADALMQLLAAHTPSIIIHGHKHRAYVQYAPGQGEAMPVFSAASLAAFPYEQNAGAGSQNQFHSIDFASTEDASALELSIAATFQSFSWIPEQGWTLCSSVDNDLVLPGVGGFGATRSKKYVARSIQNGFSGRTRLEESDLLRLVPDLPYLTPIALRGVRQALQEIGITLEISQNGAITGASQLVSVAQDEGADA